MNSAAKGTRLEREFEEMLKKEKFLTHRAKRTHFQANDIFNLFDVMAKHPDFPVYTFYFQISTDWRLQKRKPILSFPSGAYDYLFLVKRADRKPWQFRLRVGEKWSEPALYSYGIFWKQYYQYYHEGTKR